MRKEVPEIGWGDFQFLKTGANEVLGICYEWLDNAVLLLHNLSGKPCEVKFALHGERNEERYLINLLADEHSRADKSGKHCVLLEGYGYRWYRVGNLNYIQNRRDA